jgi:dihydroneopterin aldolase
MNSDFIFIDGMELACNIGTSAEERAFPQVLVARIRIYVSLASASKTDSLNDTIDYAKIIEAIRNKTQQRRYALVETIAEEISCIALAPANATAVEVEVRKKIFEGIKSVGVFIRREKRGS